MLKLIYPLFWQRKTWISYILWPFSLIYYLLGVIRYLNAKPVHFEAKVICVGNVNVGGAGKTQIVTWLAQFLAQQNIEFIIISKGYKGSLKGPLIVKSSHTAKEIGDESVLLNKYGRVIVANKIHKAVKIVNDLKPKIIIIDDGLQNPNFHKDFCILAVDGMRTIDNDFLIPAGPLRQKFTQGIDMSDAIIILNRNEAEHLNSKFKTVSKPVFNAITVPYDNKLDMDLNYLAFCSIGNPEKFFLTLKLTGFKLSNTKIFPDHHCYTIDEIEALIIQAQQYDATLITTAKDYVKIQKEYQGSNIKCFNTKLVIENENELKMLINEKIVC